jgi:hypothetical protein
MRVKLSSDALVGIEAVPVDVVVDGDRARDVEPESGRALRSVKLDKTESVGSAAARVVNGRTLSQGSAGTQPANPPASTSCSSW